MQCFDLPRDEKKRQKEGLITKTKSIIIEERRG